MHQQGEEQGPKKDPELTHDQDADLRWYFCESEGAILRAQQYEPSLSIEEYPGQRALDAAHRAIDLVARERRIGRAIALVSPLHQRVLRLAYGPVRQELRYVATLSRIGHLTKAGRALDTALPAQRKRLEGVAILEAGKLFDDARVAYKEACTHAR